ncbi:MAG: lipid A biosynthesis acyltransferase [Bacteroidota bacterium]
MYYIIYGALYLLSLLPFTILYFFSDVIYGFVYYILKYRRGIVASNLKIAFPEKSDAELNKIAKRFYHNLIDTFIETLKLLSVSQRSMMKRLTGNWELINEFQKKGRNVQIHIGHNFNWELCNVSCPANFKASFFAVYMPMTNKIFEKIFFKLRSRFGTVLLRATHMKEDFLINKDIQHVLALAVDQNPGNPASGWWFNFFGKPASFVKGPAKGAITNNTVVVFAFIHKIRRGYYEAVFTLAEENTAALNEQELTRKFVRFLENVIRTYPDMWLWSHRRWKWEWKEEYGSIID